jgi:hypothetical protein
LHYLSDVSKCGYEFIFEKVEEVMAIEYFPFLELLPTGRRKLPQGFLLWLAERGTAFF